MATQTATPSGQPSSVTTVHLPVLYPLQSEILASQAKRKVVVVGRRAGKTYLVASAMAHGMIAGRRQLYAAPTADQTESVWEYLSRWLAPAVAVGIVRRNETKRLMEMPQSGGRIRAKTAWNADTLRGDWADDLYLDEFSIMDPSAWSEVGAPMLMDNDGNAWFIFTPKRKNHAHGLFTRALGDMTGRWAAWQAASTVNPYLSESALAAMTEDLGDEAMRQEIYAEFLEGSGAVFSNIAACMTPSVQTQSWLWQAAGDGPENHAGHRMASGVDWAKKSDYHATSIVCTACAREVELHRYTGIDYSVQRQRIADACERWGVRHILAESNSMGEPSLELLRRGETTDAGSYAPLPVIGFETTASSKPPLIENLALSLERSEVMWLDCPPARVELEAYERKTSAVGRASYSAPAGANDDTVIARALARRACGRLGDTAEEVLFA